jgi:hypothetical protein
VELFVLSTDLRSPPHFKLSIIHVTNPSTQLKQPIHQYQQQYQQLQQPTNNTNTSTNTNTNTMNAIQALINSLPSAPRHNPKTGARNPPPMSSEEVLAQLVELSKNDPRLMRQIQAGLAALDSQPVDEDERKEEPMTYGKERVVFAKDDRGYTDEDEFETESESEDEPEAKKKKVQRNCSLAGCQGSCGKKRYCGSHRKQYNALKKTMSTKAARAEMEALWENKQDKKVTKRKYVFKAKQCASRTKKNGKFGKRCGKRTKHKSGLCHVHRLSARV